jgi:hypothetical protein
MAKGVKPNGERAFLTEARVLRKAPNYETFQRVWPAGPELGQSSDGPARQPIETACQVAPPSAVMSSWLA